MTQEYSGMQSQNCHLHNAPYNAPYNAPCIFYNIQYLQFSDNLSKFFAAMVKLSDSNTVLPLVKRHAGISEGEHILRNVFMLSTGMPV